MRILIREAEKPESVSIVADEVQLPAGDLLEVAVVLDDVMSISS